MVDYKPSLGELFRKLKDALVSLTNNIDSYFAETKGIITKDDVNKLRTHIQKKLDNNEEIEDSKKLKELLDLFVSDQSVIELIRSDADSWILMLDSIIDNLSKRKEPLSDEERNELEELIGIANSIKTILRKSNENKDKVDDTNS
ncbi:MAG: hypothetical protein ACP5RT_01745 [Candidatus Micrarchaeia archaeon]